MTKARFASVLSALLLIAAEPIGAQMISPMLYNGPQISLQDHADRFGSGTSETEGKGGASSAEDVRASLTYKVDAARRRQNMAQFVAKVRPVDPQGAANLEQAFAQGNFMEQIQAGLRPYGLEIDNVADAYACYWINAYQASRGDSSTPARPVVDAVKAQAARALAGTPDFARAGDAIKQEMAEALLIQAALLDGAVSGSKGNPEHLRAVSKAAMQGAAGMGLDLSKMELTQKGFVPKAG